MMDTIGTCDIGQVPGVKKKATKSNTVVEPKPQRRKRKTKQELDTGRAEDLRKHCPALRRYNVEDWHSAETAGIIHELNESVVAWRAKVKDLDDAQAKLAELENDPGESGSAKTFADRSKKVRRLTYEALCAERAARLVMQRLFAPLQSDGKRAARAASDRYGALVKEKVDIICSAGCPCREVASLFAKRHIPEVVAAELKIQAAGTGDQWRGRAESAHAELIELVLEQCIAAGWAM